MTDAQKPLIIKDFQKAVAQDPNLGHGMMKNLDIDISPGSMRVSKRFLSLITTISQSTTFTVDPATDICTAAVSLLTQAESDRSSTFLYAPVTFSSSGSLPAGLSANTVYFLIYLSNTTFKVATSWANADAGTAIDITTAGTGTHTITPVPIANFTHIVKDQRTTYQFAQDANGRVWFNRTGALYLLLNAALDNGVNPITAAAGNGLRTFLTSDGSATYLFTFRNGTIDYINVWGDSNINTPSWQNSWKSLNAGAGSGENHINLIGQDNILYFCDDRYVGSIVENAGSVLDPTNSSTYTYNNQALKLPQTEIAGSLAELGINLLVGGLTFNRIYPWDRSSSSFSIELVVPEVSIKFLVNMGNLVYIFPGRKGNIYTTQGTYVKYFRSVPQYLVNASGSTASNPSDWGGVTVINGKIYFGVHTINTNAANSGIYILYPDGRILQDNTPYSGATYLVNEIIGDTEYYSTVGGVLGGAGMADYTDTVGTRYAAGTYAAVYQSALYRVGDKTTKAGYSQIEVQMAHGATGGQGQMRLRYRFDKISNFTDFTTPSGTAVFVADGSTSVNFDIGLTDVENIMVQAEFDSDIEITEIRLFP